MKICKYTYNFKAALDDKVDYAALIHFFFSSKFLVYELYLHTKIWPGDNSWVVLVKFEKVLGVDGHFPSLLRNC